MLTRIPDVLGFYHNPDEMELHIHLCNNRGRFNPERKAIRS